jgi:Glycosyl transferases group 1
VNRECKSMDLVPPKNTSLKRRWRFRYKSALEKLRQFTPEPILNIKSKIIVWRERRAILQNQEILGQILGEKKVGVDYRAIIIFPPSLDWNMQLFQRPQQLALAFAKQGALVFYVEPTPDHNQQPFKLIHERLYLCPVHVRTFNIVPSPLVYLLSWNSRYGAQFSHPKILYDYLDDINAFEGNPIKIARNHQFLLHHAHYVLATARKLVDEVRSLRDDVIFSPNGVEYEHFARAALGEFSTPPQDMQAILAKASPVIGYYGALARWFDYELLKAVAGLRPGYQFILIGADFDSTLAIEEMRKIKNVHWLGVKPYEELPHYLQYFDVATIPFIINEVTHATSPIKLFEYMAGEKPIVITPMQESMHYPGVLVGKDPVEFAQQIDLALQMREDQSYLSLLRQTARENTWSHRAEKVLSAIENNVTPELPT